MVVGLFSPDSIAWRIHSDPSMIVGGIRALLQQALHPEAMDGVAKNSNFREDAWGRLQRTGDYVSTLTFGTPEEANALASRVRTVHTKLGLDDPKLLLWVHMSMVDSFLDCAVRSGLELTHVEQNQYVEEMVMFARLVGIPQESVPTTSNEMAEYFQQIAPELMASQDAKRAALFLTIPPLPTVVRFATPAAPMWATLSSLAGSSLPDWARKLYGWPTLPGQGIATNIALRTSRSALLRLPRALMEPPILKVAKQRWGLVSA
ncbi:unannotated protein [freshwater metagenome]|uniref:Unannotated protein n=1 Tax=freshwater metagenome TaxID=449393 RepID=A0A6J6L1F9_9ZZZZ|nr:DUF2236 domain-containing protein [Actinomycetota bacterium]